jgi:hypothetical protein
MLIRFSSVMGDGYLVFGFKSVLSLLIFCAYSLFRVKRILGFLPFCISSTVRFKLGVVFFYLDIGFSKFNV